MTGSKKLLRFAKNENFYENMSALTSFCNIGQIYAWTNEKIKDYYDRNLEDKKLLCVTASADHALHGVLAGAKEIDCFDINEFCKYYAALKIAMIKRYDLNEFLFLIDRFIIGICKYIYKVLNDIESLLTKEEFAFWTNYLSCCAENMFFGSKLFIEESCYNTNNAYTKKNEFETLKTNLNNCKIVYYDSLAEDLHQKLFDKKYDVIYFSNIISRGSFLDEKRLYEMMFNLSSILNRGGVIYDYHFGEDVKLRSIFGGCYDALCATYDIEPVINKECEYVLTYKKK